MQFHLTANKKTSAAVDFSFRTLYNLNNIHIYKSLFKSSSVQQPVIFNNFSLF
jgi:hypothetical protein